MPITPNTYKEIVEDIVDTYGIAENDAGPGRFRAHSDPAGVSFLLEDLNDGYMYRITPMLTAIPNEEETPTHD